MIFVMVLILCFMWHDKMTSHFLGRTVLHVCPQEPAQSRDLVRGSVVSIAFQTGPKFQMRLKIFSVLSYLQF